VLGCAMGGRERCLLVANERVWRGEVLEMYWGARRERDICAWLRHGREGELRFVYKELGFKLFGNQRITHYHHVHHSMHRMRGLSGLDSGSSEERLLQWRGLPKLSKMGQTGSSASL
jgi:hypothetical protein